ncbi:hypothetical protein SLS58_006409 [Diplodia intermedia]|uniref:Uncharacterized protein n=1 Tax=Diplodia intermedia TaxID=856260 RepID=A0ABR3TNJ0_9PEZI
MLFDAALTASFSLSTTLFSTPIEPLPTPTRLERRSTSALSPDLLDSATAKLMRYAWPGTVGFGVRITRHWGNGKALAELYMYNARRCRIAVESSRNKSSSPFCRPLALVEQGQLQCISVAEYAKLLDNIHPSLPNFNKYESQVLGSDSQRAVVYLGLISSPVFVKLSKSPNRMEACVDTP